MNKQNGKWGFGQQKNPHEPPINLWITKIVQGVRARCPEELDPLFYELSIWDNKNSDTQLT